jgi:hypothetical protein
MDVYFILHLVKHLFFLIKVIGLEYIIENARSIDISQFFFLKKKNCKYFLPYPHILIPLLLQNIV